MKRIITHGEVNFIECDSLSKDLNKLEVTEDFFIVGESETHGNDHRINVSEGIDLYTSQLNELFLSTVKKETTVFCPNRGKHDPVTIPKGVWKIVKGREYDYFTDSHRFIAD